VSPNRRRGGERCSGVGQYSLIALDDYWEPELRAGGIEDRDHARNFAHRVALNLARSHLRRRIAAPFGLSGPDRATHDPVASSAAWLDAVAALEHLSPKQRSCIVLVDYADLDAATASAILGMAEATVRVHLLHGRRAMRARLDLPEEGPA